MFGKRVKALKEEVVAAVNENAKLREVLSKAKNDADLMEEKVLRFEKAVADMEKELKERIQENHKLQFEVSSKNNTINQLKAEKEKLKPKRDSKGKFVKK